MFEVGLIRVITLDDLAALNLHGRLIMRGYPDVRVESRCIAGQPEGLHSREMAAAAVPKVLEVARGFAEKDMVVVSCAADPGVAELRASMPHMPIAGAGEAVAALALRYGTRVAAMGITDYAPPALPRILGERLVAWRMPQGVASTLDLQTQEGRASCVETALELKRAGADVIALACTGMATTGVARDIHEACGLPVVDPVLALGAAIAFEAAQRRLDDDVSATHALDIEGTCSRIAQACGLTAREEELLHYIAHGRSVAFIQDRLMLSRNTVKTHMDHIYTKLGVHSQQEIIDMVESHETGRVGRSAVDSEYVD